MVIPPLTSLDRHEDSSRNGGIKCSLATGDALCGMAFGSPGPAHELWIPGAGEGALGTTKSPRTRPWRILLWGSKELLVTGCHTGYEVGCDASYNSGHDHGHHGGV